MQNLNITRDQANTVFLGGAVGGIISPTLISVGIGIAFALIMVLLLKKIG